MATTSLHKFSKWASLISGLVELLIFLGTSINFFFILDSMKANGHFCPEGHWKATNSSRVRECFTDEGKKQQEATKSAIVTVGLAMFNLPAQGLALMKH